MSGDHVQNWCQPAPEGQNVSPPGEAWGRIWRRNAVSKRPNVNNGMCILFTFSLFEASGQRRACPPGFAWGFPDDASSRLTRFVNCFF